MKYRRLSEYHDHIINVVATSKLSQNLHNLRTEKRIISRTPQGAGTTERGRMV
jgi:hypothetical protein